MVPQPSRVDYGQRVRPLIHARHIPVSPSRAAAPPEPELDPEPATSLVLSFEVLETNWPREPLFIRGPGPALPLALQ